MLKNIKTAIIGVGLFYEEQANAINRNFDVTACFDNDILKQGKEVNGFTVMHPDKVLSFSFDVILIMSDAFSSEIRKQLLNIGVDNKKIITYSSILKLCDKDVVNFVMHKTSKQDRLLLACMPKSGSTYLKKVFGSLPHFSEVSFVPGYGQREQEICAYTLLKVMLKNESFIAQHHVRYSEETSKVINDFDLKVVVLVRNIFDVVISFYDHWGKESTIFPMAVVPDDWATWDKEKAYDFIVTMIVPWYFNFYVSWMKCIKKDNVVLVNYDDFMNKKIEVITGVCQSLMLTVDSEELNLALDNIESKQTRKNVGTPGRGQMLSAELKEKIKNMSAYYHGVDFSSMGL